MRGLGLDLLLHGADVVGELRLEGGELRAVAGEGV
jgi:hypothetical protein